MFIRTSHSFLVLCGALRLSLVDQTLGEQHHNCSGEEEIDKCEKTLCITVSLLLFQLLFYSYLTQTVKQQLFSYRHPAEKRLENILQVDKMTSGSFLHAQGDAMEGQEIIRYHHRYQI